MPFLTNSSARSAAGSVSRKTGFAPALAQQCRNLLSGCDCCSDSGRRDGDADDGVSVAAAAACVIGAAPAENNRSRPLQRKGRVTTHN